MNRFLPLILAALAFPCIPSRAADEQRIDREALVTRRNPVLHQLDATSPLSVGNGEFAFTADVTGLQTFTEPYEKETPLCTQSQWGWHSAPNPEGYSMERYKYSMYESHGRQVGYANHKNGDPAGTWLRNNPHRMHLGRIALQLTKRSGEAATPQDLSAIEQKLDLYRGSLHSEFQFDGEKVRVETICHPERDLIAVRIESPLVGDGRLKVELSFPYPSPKKTAADWTQPGAHTTTLAQPQKGRADFTRVIDDTHSFATAVWKTPASIAAGEPHHFVLAPNKKEGALEFVCAFAPKAIAGDLPDFSATKAGAEKHWNEFWTRGAAIDFSHCTDPRAQELERRVVLSQYLTAIQCAGSLPPQETGLTFNSWNGKFHLEMHWWHEAQFALWNRIDLLEKSLPYYNAILPVAQANAKRQGYAGARWPKMADPAGNDSPSPIGPFLIWQQPHPIYYAELCWRAHPGQRTLEAQKDVVFQTAEFMASYAALENDRYVLGPPLQLAQERFPKDTTMNGTFELAYWRWALETAQKWKERLHLPREENWDHVLAKLSPLPVKDGLYVAAETAPDTFEKFMTDHPSMLGALGFLPGPGVDSETMRATLHKVLADWHWDDTWGWDCPMVAMTAARLGEPETAVSMLLRDTPKNGYRLNGHNPQAREDLPIYLPGNGALLAAVAMMAGGWDGTPGKDAPGFPKDGKWNVRAEGFAPMP
ncbi:MAG: hypothetical protein QOD99_294 [Chthoniobacter sp.]|jgi:hypothetical protein|nr:hypothetical protein [Chthoniobacter sp.]